MVVDVNVTVNATINVYGFGTPVDAAAVLSAINDLRTAMDSKLQDILDNEDHEATAVGQLATAVQGLQTNVATLTTELQAALSGATLPTAVQDQVNAAFAKSKANSDSVDAILTSLAPVTPPAPGPTVDPATGPT